MVATETNVVLIVGQGNEASHVLKAAEMQGWSAQQIKTLEDVPPREHIDPEVVVLTSDIPWLTMNAEQKHVFGNRVIWMTPQDAWEQLQDTELTYAISKNASAEEIRYHMVQTIKRLNKELMAKIGLSTSTTGEALWDMMPGTDWVTGVANRTSFVQEVRKQISRSKRYKRPFSCVLVQFNNFKNLNSKLQDEVMEKLLSDVAGLLEMCIRDADMLARIEDNTFAMVLPETDKANTQPVEDRIRDYLDNFKFEQELPETPSFSIGVSSFDSKESSLDSLLKQAQKGLLPGV